MQQIKLNVADECTTYLCKYTTQQYIQQYINSNTNAYASKIQQHSKSIKCVYVIKQYDEYGCIARSSNIVIKLHNNTYAIVTHTLHNNKVTYKQATFIQCIQALFTLDDLT